MKKRTLATLVGLAAVAAFTLTSTAVAKHPKDRDEQTILVKFVSPSTDADEAIQEEGDEVGGELVTRVKIVRVKGKKVEDAIAKYSERGDVEYVELDGEVGAEALPAPSDPSYPMQTFLGNVKALDAWAIAPGSYGVGGMPAIAIVDSGVEATHPDLAGRVQTNRGADCQSGVCTMSAAGDDSGHGTHVAGITAASTDNLTGGAGLAFGASIIPVKVLDSTNSGTFAALAAGIIHAADQGARIINLSLGVSASSQTVCDAVSYAISRGALVVAAAGNSGSSTPFSPASCPGAFGVAATEANDTRATFSNTGYPNVSIAAPGVNILSTGLNGSYKYDTGTSMSAAVVSGIADLMLTANPSRTALDVKRVLAASADKVGSTSYGTDPHALCAGCTWNSSFGYGRVNALRALTTAVPAAAPDFAMSATPPSLTVTQGLKGTYSVSSQALNGFSSSVSLAVTGLPSGASASWSRSSISGGTGSQTLTITAGTSTPAGTYTLSIKGTSGALVRTLPVALVIATPVPTFTMTASPTTYNARFGRSATATYKIAVAVKNGFSGTITFGYTGGDPAVAPTLSPTSLAVVSGKTYYTYLKVPIPATTPRLSTQYQVTGFGNGVQGAVSLTLNVA